jgi:hypothetical protein
VKPGHERGRSAGRNRKASNNHPPSLTENGHDASQGAFNQSRFFQQVREELQARATAAAKPATDAQLAQIWPPWNDLPLDMTPEVRRRVLVEDGAEIQQHLERLRLHFDYLPLDPNVFRRALDTATTWTRLVAFAQTTAKHRTALVEHQRAFRDADSHLTERIANARAANELQLTNPGLLESKAPTEADIEMLRGRYRANRWCRFRALVMLRRLIYKVPIRTGRRLPLEEQALGIPYPHEDAPSPVHRPPGCPGDLQPGPIC